MKSAFLLIAGLLAARGDDLATMKKDVQAIVEARAKKYNCSFSVAVKTPSLDGPAMTWTTDGITPSSKFAWGSITKMWTGASIMQLVEKGVFGLDDKITPFADAQIAKMKATGKFPKLTFSKLSDLFGPQVEEVTFHNVLHMASGIPDFDTANPSRSGKDEDPFRAEVYKNPKHNYDEPELMSLPWVATHNLTSTPGKGFHYSSTNFGILGLILAGHAGADDYLEFNQSSFIPDSMGSIASLSDITWGTSGSPADHDVVPGYDRTDYNGQSSKGPGVPVVDVNGVFCGYSASDFIGPPAAVAEIGYALWGSKSTLVSPALRDLMVPNGTSFRSPGAEFYGLASQNVGMMGIAGGIDPRYNRAYGHLGATYGYDSIFGYNPTLDLGIAVASNIETLEQTQPADTYCGVYNRVKNYLLQERVQTCVYDTSGYYGGTCKCK